MLTSASHQASGVDKIAMSSPPSDKPIGSEYPYLKGISVPVYCVPAGSRCSVKGLTFSGRPNIAGLLTNASTVNAGVWKASIGAQQLCEFRFHDQAVPYPPGADEIVVPFYSAFQLPSLGEGVICPSGTSLTITVTPGQDTPIVWYASVFTKTAMLHTRVVTSMTTDDQTILTMLAGVDQTILSIAVNADMSGQFIGQANICADGQVLCELPPFGMEASTPTFARADGYGGCLGALTLPLWNMTFGEGQSLSFDAMPFTNDDSRMTLMVAGTEDAYPTAEQIAAAVWSREGRTLTS